ncbi:hypothetical protein ACRAWD_21945 [Caulobacter segnis]
MSTPEPPLISLALVISLTMDASGDFGMIIIGAVHSEDQLEEA